MLKSICTFEKSFISTKLLYYPYVATNKKLTHVLYLFCMYLTLFIASFFLAGVVLGGGGFHLYPVTPFSLKLNGSNFMQNYFGIRSISCNKKNQDQIDNDVTMTSFFL